MTVTRTCSKTLLRIMATMACVLVGAQAGMLATSKKKAVKGKSTEAAPQLAWPLAPEEARIRYVTTYRGVDDFKPAKKPSRFLKALLGAEDPGSQPSDWMMKPYGIAVSPEGRLYVADTAARRVFAFDMDAKTVSFSWIRVSSAAVEFFYAPAAPCQWRPGQSQTLALHR